MSSSSKVKGFAYWSWQNCRFCHQGNAAEDGRRNEISKNCKFFEKICNVGYPVSSVTLPQTKNKACRENSSQKKTKDKS